MLDGTKWYVGVIGNGRLARRAFRTFRAADAYVDAVRLRYRRLWDAQAAWQRKRGWKLRAWLWRLWLRRPW